MRYHSQCTTDKNINIDRGTLEQANNITGTSDDEVDTFTDELIRGCRRPKHGAMIPKQLGIYFGELDDSNNSKDNANPYEKAKQSINKIRDALVNGYFSSLNALLHKHAKEKNKRLHRHSSARRHSHTPTGIPPFQPPAKMRVRSLSLAGRADYDEILKSRMRPTFDETREIENSKRTNKGRGSEQTMGSHFDEVHASAGKRQSVVERVPSNLHKIRNPKGQREDTGKYP